MEKLHPNVTLNFMLNRLKQNVEPEELESLASGITNLDEWVDVALTAADAALAEHRYGPAASYYRGAEFFMAPDHPRKSEAYDRYLENFDRINPEVAALRSSVPFEGGELAIIDIRPDGETKDVVVACSGFDGLIEEMYEPSLVLSVNGYRVVLYEGPGQGAALRRHHLPMIHDWERPVGVILDHLQIDSCTLLGVSLGGYLAPRAAAFEPRCKRVIAWGAMYEFIDCFRLRMGEEAYNGILQLLDNEQRDTVNQLITAGMESDTTTRWSITHGMHTCGGESPFDFLTWARQLHLKEVSDQITQDALIIGASRDHLVPTEQVWAQAAALKQAKSITARMFTEQENAEEHCQVTNTGVVYREILGWLEALQVRDTECQS